MAQNPLSSKPSNVLLIDETYLKSTTELTSNVDPNFIFPAIARAQDLFIAPIIGSYILEEIKQQLTGNTLSSANSVLLYQYIQPTLAASSMAEMLPFLNWQFKNKGVEQSKSEFSDPVGKEEINILVEKYKETAENYAQKMTNFLLQNTDAYPNYLDTQGYLDVVKPNRSSYFSGFYIPNYNSDEK